MVCNYKRKGERQSWGSGNMLKAIEAVKASLTAATTYNVPRNTLKRRVLNQNMRATGNKKEFGEPPPTDRTAAPSLQAGSSSSNTSVLDKTYDPQPGSSFYIRLEDVSPVPHVSGEKRKSNARKKGRPFHASVFKSSLAFTWLGGISFFLYSRSLPCRCPPATHSQY
uniref:(California timema) hypothetical protein n=1 Tax=Timema californicum TaxID=61474 RepID=A0A7R9PDA3_TIMCA|nr:unnamed protein product [Timema californicum]